MWGVSPGSLLRPAPERPRDGDSISMPREPLSPVLPSAPSAPGTLVAGRAPGRPPSGLPVLDTLGVLTLAQTRGVGPKAVRLALCVAADLGEPVRGADDLFDLLAEVRRQVPRTKAVTREQVEAGAASAADILAQSGRAGMTVVALGDDGYPPALARIDDAPAVLFCRGDLAAASCSAVAVVGAREPSDYGRRSARRMGTVLAEAGFVVVSGLALGCDGEAHEGCLDGGGRTVAVLAHGLDRIYPPAHAGLAERIVGGGGALVSEYPPGAAPQARTFVARNRIQSGLSAGVVVVETTRDGGTMHTARFAIAQGRPLACVARPGGPALAGGNEDLLASGAAVTLDSAGAAAAFLGGPVAERVQDEFLFQRRSKLADTPGLGDPPQGSLFL